jgi:peptidoglycan/LPS O-acetylase OafA/YrhL
VHVPHLHLLNNNSVASKYFDLLRGIAALWVMVFHLRPVLYDGYSHLTNPNIVTKGTYFLTSIGPQWVMVFFVLSGFLISSTILKSVMMRQTVAWGSYLLNRLTRLWIVLIPALLLTLVWAKLQIGLYGDGQGYFTNNLGVMDFLGNIFFLQGIYSPDYGGNIALWSLTFEFWYYLLFPCAVLAVVSSTTLKKCLYGLLFLGMLLFVGKTIILYFTIWLLGTAILFVPPMKISHLIMSYVLLPSAVVMFFISLSLGKLYGQLIGLQTDHLITNFPPNLCVGVCTAFLLYIILNVFNQKQAATVSKFSTSTFLAGFSYTLYLTHYPIVNYLRVSIGDGRWGTWQPSLTYLLAGIAITIGLLGYAWVVAYFTENKTAFVKHKIKSLRFVTLTRLPTKEVGK